MRCLLSCCLSEGLWEHIHHLKQQRAATGTPDSQGALEEQQTWWTKPGFNVTVSLLMLLVFTEGFCLSQVILAFYLILYIVLSEQDLSTSSVLWAYKRLKASPHHKPREQRIPTPVCGGEALVQELLWFKWMMCQAGFFYFPHAACTATHWILHTYFPWMSSIQSLEAGPPSHYRPLETAKPKQFMPHLEENCFIPSPLSGFRRCQLTWECFGVSAHTPEHGEGKKSKERKERGKSQRCQLLPSNICE